VHVHSAPRPAPVASSYQPQIPLTSYAGHGGVQTGGYEVSAGYGSAPIALSYHQAPSVNYGDSPQVGGY
jgi:hypothetical protein